MSSETKIAPVQTGGIGVVGLLGVVFVTLKLLGITAVASWPWIWVLAPFWIPFLIGLVIVVIFLIILGIANKY